jgi:hypothetical protein
METNKKKKNKTHKHDFNGDEIGLLKEINTFIEKAISEARREKVEEIQKKVLGTTGMSYKDTFYLPLSSVLSLLTKE